MSEPVAITGFALASPFGPEPQAFWRGVCHGPTPAIDWTPAPDFPGLASMGLECRAAVLPDAPPIGRGGAGGRMIAVSEDLARRALAMAGLGEPPPGLGLALGSAWAEADHFARPKFLPAPPILPTLARALGLSGPLVNTPVNCAAGNVALAWAVGRIRAGEAPMMLAGGVDLIGPLAVGAYVFLDNLTSDLPRPFDAGRDGFLLAEGGALFVLEPLASARKAGRTVLATIVGVGAGHDASHPTRPSPDGRGQARAMRMALADAGLAPAEIGYLNAHSPGTPINDPGEAAAIAAVFGPRGVPVSSTKGALGHAQGGANALEAVACLLALRDRLIPPTLNHRTLPADFEIDHVANMPRALSGDHALSVAASMGGATSAAIFARADAWS